MSDIRLFWQVKCDVPDCENTTRAHAWHLDAAKERFKEQGWLDYRGQLYCPYHAACMRKPFSVTCAVVNCSTELRVWAYSQKEAESLFKEHGWLTEVDPRISQAWFCPICRQEGVLPEFFWPEQKEGEKENE
jgi:hypothetical protein